MVHVSSILSTEEQHSLIKQYLHSDEFQIKSYKEEQIENGRSTSLHFIIFFKSTEQVLRFLVKNHISKEVLWHRDIFSSAAFNPDFSCKFYFLKEQLVTEDLHQIGFTSSKEYDLEHVKISLRTLAKYHAGSIIFEEQESKKLGRKFKLINKYPEFITDDELLENSKNLYEVLDQLGHGEFKDRLSTLIKTLKNKNWDNFRCVLCHGSLWGSNVLFKYQDGDPVDCKIVSFDSLHYSPPAFDVLQLIYMSTDQEFRKRHLHGLLKFYYNWLKKELAQKKINVEEVLPLLEDFELSVHQTLPYIKLQRSLLYLEKCSDENKEEIKNIEEDYALNVLIEESLSELEHFVTHPGLTLEDCFRIIKSKLNTVSYELISYKIKPLSDISGFVGDHNKLIIEVSVEGKKQVLNLFAKFIPKTSVGASVAADSGGYIKEMFMYQQYFPMLKNVGIDISECIVPCHFARHDDVIVLDDMSASNYNTLSPREPFSCKMLKMVIEKVAKLHASSIIYEEEMGKQTQSTYRINEQIPEAVKEGVFVVDENHSCYQWALTGLQAIEFELEFFPDSSITNQELKLKIQKAFERMLELIKPSKEFRNVLCHADLWTSNILIQESTDCRFIDFQICRYCPPAHDLLCVLYLTSDRQVRENHFKELVDFYHSELGENLKKYGYNIQEIYSYETFWKSIDHMIPQVVVQTALYSHLIYLTSDLIKERLVDEEAWKVAFIKDRRELITFAMGRDDIYTKCLRAVIQDLREMCIKYF